MNKEEMKQAWLTFATSAVAGFSAASDPEDTELEDIAEDSCKLADIMLQEYASRAFETRETRGKGAGRRRKKVERERDDDEDDGDDEE